MKKSIIKKFYGDIPEGPMKKRIIYYVYFVFTNLILIANSLSLLDSIFNWKGSAYFLGEIASLIIMFVLTYIPLRFIVAKKE